LGRLVAACFITLALLAPLDAGMAAGGGTIALRTASGDHNYNIEVMATDHDRARGLMYRRSLPENAGMLFLYERPQPAAMWMKNTLIPLDMVFIAAGGRVHRIETNAEPFSLTPIPSDGDIVAVLELNAGQAGKIGLKRGDQVVYPGLGEKTSW
jgi:uncharacterized membrane protein (UPF0127 family)